MKAIIENEVINTSHRSLRILSKIIEVIVSASNEQELRNGMRRVGNIDKYFQYGFGSTHMWVNEIGSRNRLLIVEF